MILTDRYLATCKGNLQPLIFGRGTLPTPGLAHRGTARFETKPRIHLKFHAVDIHFQISCVRHSSVLGKGSKVEESNEQARTEKSEISPEIIPVPATGRHVALPSLAASNSNQGPRIPCVDIVAWNLYGATRECDTGPAECKLPNSPRSASACHMRARSL